MEIFGDNYSQKPSSGNLHYNILANKHLIFCVMEAEELLHFGYEKSVEGTYYKWITNSVMIEYNPESTALAIKLDVEVICLPAINSPTKLIQFEGYLQGMFTYL